VAAAVLPAVVTVGEPVASAWRTLAVVERWVDDERLLRRRDEEDVEDEDVDELVVTASAGAPVAPAPARPDGNPDGGPDGSAVASRRAFASCSENDGGVW